MDDLLKQVYYLNSCVKDGIGEIINDYEDGEVILNSINVDCGINNLDLKNELEKYKFYIKMDISKNTTAVLLSCFNPERKENINHINGVHDFYIIKKDNKDICILTTSENVFYFYWIEEPQNIVEVIKKDLPHLINRNMNFSTNRLHDIKAFGNYFNYTPYSSNKNYNDYYKPSYIFKNHIIKNRNLINYKFLDEINNRIKLIDDKLPDFLYNWGDSISNSYSLFTEEEVEVLKNNPLSCKNYDIVYSYTELINDTLSVLYLKKEELGIQFDKLVIEINRIIKYKPYFEDKEKYKNPVLNDFIFEPLKYGSHCVIEKNGIRNDCNDDYEKTNKKLSEIFSKLNKGTYKISVSSIKIYLENIIGYFTPKQILTYFNERGFRLKFENDGYKMKSLSGIYICVDFDELYDIYLNIEIQYLNKNLQKVTLNEEKISTLLKKFKAEKILTDSYGYYSLSEICDDIKFEVYLANNYEEIEYKYLLLYVYQYLKKINSEIIKINDRYFNNSKDNSLIFMPNLLIKL